jgi:hypothetical protein
MTQPISAYLTDLARKLIARGLTEGVLLGDWSFQVGSGGYNPLDPTDVLDVDPSLQALLAPIGSPRPLGRVRDSGVGASASLTAENGVIQIDGLLAIPDAVSNRYLTIAGAVSANLNGTWPIRQWLSSTSVAINAPLVTDADAGPLTWELRDLVTFKPNPSASDFHARLSETEEPGVEVAEIAIFCRVLLVPAVTVYPLPVPVGTRILFANAHFTPFIKDTNMVANFHVCVQV